MLILGLNAFSHHASAALVTDKGKVIAAVEEERFTRIKRDARFPTQSIQYCLREARVPARELTGIAFGWSPGHFAVERVLRSHFFDYPVKLRVKKESLRWLWRMCQVRSQIERNVGSLSRRCQTAYFPHHSSHAGSAWFAAPFEESAFLTVDGRGEVQSMTWGTAQGTRMKRLGELRFPHSLGKLYSAICRYLGFDQAEKDGTVMALAACGRPEFQKEFNALLSWRPDRGIESLRLDASYFDLADVAGPSRQMETLFGQPARRAGDELTDFHRNVAATLQQVVQDVIVEVATRLQVMTGRRRLVMAGGVALNTVANGLIADRAGFEAVFIQPASHDGGLALGAACMMASEGRRDKPDWHMDTAALGPGFTDSEILAALGAFPTLTVRRLKSPAKEAAKRVARGEMVGWFQGRMEYGPRALGQRCLLADPRLPDMKDRLNRIKGRESFRPFAVAVLAEEAGRWLRRRAPSPFMLLVDSINPALAGQVPGAHHVDGSVRVQTVEKSAVPLFHELIRHFFRITKVPLVASTSLNIRGEPIACAPRDALQLVTSTTLDALVIGSFVVTRGSGAPES